MSLLEYGSSLVPEAHSRISTSQENRFRVRMEQVIKNKQLPDEGFDPAQIERIINEAAAADTNNFPGKLGGGEREGRVYSQLVAARHYHLSHGIGRSGNISDPQPKAVGSSIISLVTDHLALEAFRVAGVKGLKSSLVVPMATGMALRECMIALRLERSPEAVNVIWPRIDQKSCLKSMLSLGLKVHVIEPKITEKGLVTDIDAIKSKVNELGAASVLAIHTTISCFAPRQPDSLEAVSLLCHQNDIPHLVNGAYFLQSEKSVNQLNSALGKNRRVDAVVASTDKNFMTPVGGAVICSPEKGKSSLAVKVASNYPGRASMSPKLDLFMTLLAMGRNGYKELLDQQRKLFKHALDKLEALASRHKLRVLSSNGISLALSLEGLKGDLKEIGSMLFTRNVSGPRVVTCSDEKQIGPVHFTCFGSSSAKYQTPYIALAVAIGMCEAECDGLLEKIDAVLCEYKKSTS